MTVPDYTFEQFKNAVGLLYHWQNSGGTNFAAQLYRLIAKADAENRKRLIKGFPEYVAAYDEWQQNKDMGDFFIRYGVDYYNEKT